MTHLTIGSFQWVMGFIEKTFGRREESLELYLHSTSFTHDNVLTYIQFTCIHLNYFQFDKNISKLRVNHSLTRSTRSKRASAFTLKYRDH